jgi:uncharacterized membrane protein
VPLHPLIVHVPLVLAGLTPLVAGYLAWRTSRGQVSRAAWAVAVALQIVIFVGAWTAMATGKHEASIVRAVVGRDAIGEHADAAQRFMWASFAVLAALVAATFLRGRRGAIAGGAATALALVTLALGIRAGHLGGGLVFEHDAPRAYQPAAPTAAPATPTPPPAR